MSAPVLEQSGFAAEPPIGVTALELTFETLGRRELLTRDAWLDVLGRSIDDVFQRHQLLLRAFVFLPDRVRLVIDGADRKTRLPWIVYVIKRAAAHAIRRDLRESRDPLLKKLTVRVGHGKYVFRAWEPGLGRVRKLTSAAELAEVIGSIHDSPVSRGLCATPPDWTWSSWRAYHASGRAAEAATPRVTAWSHATRSHAAREAEASHLPAAQPSPV